MGKFRFFVVMVLLGILFACASTGNATSMGLDAAIQQASKDISDSLPAGTKVALINFTSPSDVFSDYVLEEMSISLVKERKLVVVDRKEIDLIRREMNFQMSGEVSDASAQEIGAMLGAQSIVSGSLVNMGDAYRFRTKVINVNSAAIQTSSSITFNDSPQVQHLLGQSSGARPAAQTAQAQKQQDLSLTIVNNTGNTINGIGLWPSDSNDNSKLRSFDLNDNLRNGGSTKIVIPSVDISVKHDVFLFDPDDGIYRKKGVSFTQNMSITYTSADKAQLASSAPSAPAASATPASTASKAYKIGDTGPAGGLIFYDKGNNSGGWRYLEAAPEETEFQAVWSVRNTVVENTRTEIGTGRRNTQLIVEKFKQTSGEWDTAAQVCVDLDINGYKDWFFPSKDELDQMYGNLKRKNLGDFKNELYSSSTEAIDYNNSLGCACTVNFKNGEIFAGGFFAGRNKNIKYYVRPIRQFAGN